MQKLLSIHDVSSETIIDRINENIEKYSDDVTKIWKKQNAGWELTASEMPRSALHFEILLRVLKEKKTPLVRKAPSPALSDPKFFKKIYRDGSVENMRKSSAITIKVNTADHSRFLDFIESRLPDLIKEFEP